MKKKQTWSEKMAKVHVGDACPFCEGRMRKRENWLECSVDAEHHSRELTEDEKPRSERN